jgi:drug/metabolite transporter, DME family
MNKLSSQVKLSAAPAGQQPDSHPLRGYLFIASAAFLWGVSAALGRAVFTGKLSLAGEAQHPIDPIILSQTRTTFSLIVLLPLLVTTRGWKCIQLPRRDLVQCLVLGMLGVAASNYFYYYAIQKTNVATAIIVQYTAPVWVLIYVVARRQQKLSLRKVAAVALSIIGLALVIGLFSTKSSNSALHLDPLGIAAALVAAFSFAFYNVAGHSVLARYDRWRVLTWTLIAASVFWLFANPPWKITNAHYSIAQWIFLFVFSMISVLGAFSLYFLGLQYLEPTRAIIVSCLEPVFSILLAAALLGETLRPLQTIGIVCVLMAIVLTQSAKQDTNEEKSRQSVVMEPIE